MITRAEDLGGLALTLKEEDVEVFVVHVYLLHSHVLSAFSNIILKDFFGEYDPSYTRKNSNINTEGFLWRI